jgi:hypothetical protein
MEVDCPRVPNGPARMLVNWSAMPEFDALGPLETIPPQFAAYAVANRLREREEHWPTARLFDQACRCLADWVTADSFFLHVDCFAPHEPWDPPPRFVKAYDPVDKSDGTVDPRGMIHHRDAEFPTMLGKRLAGWYAASVAWADHCFGTLLDALEKTGLVHNTTVIVTSDHGTRMGEFGQYGKRTPLSQVEAHVPLMIRVPGESGGRTDRIAQPQDLFATVCRLAGLELPEGLASYDLLDEPAQPGPRSLAAAGRAPLRPGPDTPLCTIFDGNWSLEMTANPGSCRLRPMGDLTDFAAEKPDRVGEMWSAGLSELARRGMRADWLRWVQSGGRDELPKAAPCDNWPPPRGYRVAYWQNLDSVGEVKIKPR